MDFTTSGTADLTITATTDLNYTSETTRWSNESEDSLLYDLRFLELRCGGMPLAYEWQGESCNENECSVFIPGFTCNETAKETSLVLTPSRHVLRFNYGGEEAFAYNEVLTNVSACRTFSTANSQYTLNQSVSIAGATCFTVSAANVTLDCNGFSITGNNTTSTYGAYSTQSNTTVKNCNISNFQHAIYFNGAGNGTIENNTVSTAHATGNGIYVNGGGRQQDKSKQCDLHHFPRNLHIQFP